MPENKNKYRIIGLMSGTSLDGLDIADCIFTIKNNRWSFQIVRATTFPYPAEWKQKLSHAPYLDARGISELTTKYGSYTGEKVNEFLNKDKDRNNAGIEEYDLIVSHGHTIFHQPENGFTLQIGDPNKIYAKTGIAVLSDLRSLDIALGGQGAPLVPVGDVMLFGEYGARINLGGFSNISYSSENKLLAYDVSPVNIVLNELAAKLGMEYDRDGVRGRDGNIDKDLLDRLNAIPYYGEHAPKSLGREWLEEEFLPVLDSSDTTTVDKLRSMYEHIAIQLGAAINSLEKGPVLFTGGGAHNSFLMERIAAHSNHDIKVPAKDIIDYKEAIIFAFIGVLRLRGENYSFSSVTGASSDSCGGQLTGTGRFSKDPVRDKKS